MLGVGLNQLNNLRRSGYLHPVGKKDGDYLYPEKDRVLLAWALPLLNEGIKPQIAFERANEKFESLAAQVAETISELAEKSGRRPGLREVERQIPAAPIEAGFFDCLVEENLIGRTVEGAFFSKSVFQPALVAYSRGSRDPGWTTLAGERKVEIRNLVLSVHINDAQPLFAGTAIRMPVESLLKSVDIAFEYRTLALGYSGFNDPSERVIFISDELRTNEEKRRFVLMHEFFHIKLGHTISAHCMEEGSGDMESEANYAAIHYLIPAHTFDLVARKCLDGNPSAATWHKKIAREYGVPSAIVKQYLKERSLEQRP